MKPVIIKEIANGYIVELLNEDEIHFCDNIQELLEYIQNYYVEEG